MLSEEELRRLIESLTIREIIAYPAHETFSGPVMGRLGPIGAQTMNLMIESKLTAT